MRILLDTHVVIWLATEPESIPLALQGKIGDADQRLISVVSFAEVGFKRRKYGDRFGFTLEHMEQALLDLKAMELPLIRGHLERLASLPVLHKDPFDHLLLSQALAENVELATLDADVRKYGAAGIRYA
ncbi:MAG: type II toxin-antitoxin system VapC family toxin [Bryobacterales bacterium]|nr:type II toxin-antitoxin system VapC family toxin [Bryobacterales bacterium]